MLEYIYWIAFGATIAVAGLWLFLKWVKEPREGRGPSR